MSKLKSIESNVGKIKLIEDTVSEHLVTINSPLVFTFWHLQVLPSEFNRVSRFYYPTIFTTSILPFSVGDRVQLIEISNKNLLPTGRSCFRFIKGLKCLPALMTDDDFYDIELSVIPVGKI